MNKAAITMMMLVTMLAITGCINIEYTGRKFTAQDHVRYTESAGDVDLDNYTLIGRFTVTSRTKTHPYEVEEAVMEKAREFGGDILLLTEVTVIPHGAYTTNEGEFGAPRAADRRNHPEETARFGRQSALTSRPATTNRRVFRYLLYKKSDEVSRQLGY